ncbi:hypothetical protein F441_12527 [Phytophthora nicotianae CJ01A1]|uniref:Uncharacterized protein n=1 Tax=Phytophthora nicotianae CJ01A1 TaxID=1317063 RepID=W2WNC9_PHYNI|nr:hypothetical protein F441_12527 [Phytophthora nicotianae CJ01A1]
MTDLQKQGQHIDVVHEIFQMMVEDYPELSDYLAADAEISHNPLFEKACVKIISRKQELLTYGEKAQVSHFLRQPEPQESALEGSTGSKRSYASLLRDRKRQRLTTSEDYVDQRFISGTSASAERLFSSAKHVLRHLWNADMVSQAMKARSTTES